MAGEDDVEFGNLASDLARDRQAGVGDSYDEIGPFPRAQLLDEIVQTFDPGGVHSPKLGGRVALAGADIGDADECDLHALPLQGHGRIEEALAADRVVKIVTDDRTFEPAHGLLEPLGTVGRLPIARDESVEAERVKRVENDLPFGPGRRAGALEIIASVQQEADRRRNLPARAR